MTINVATTTFASIVKMANELESYLQSHGISLHSSSVIAQAIRGTHQVQTYYEKGEVPDDYDAEVAVSDVANLWYLGRAVMGAVGTPFEAVIKDRLPTLTRGDPSPLTPGNQSNERDRIFELVCARICSLFASDVAFGEPDVLATYRGKRWGLACKSAYGSPTAVAKAVRKGTKQIERSDIDFGMIVVQLTNIFPHDRMYSRDPSTGEIITYHYPEALSALIRSLTIEMSEPIEGARRKLFQRYPFTQDWRVRGILYVAQTVCFFRETRTIMGCCRLVDLGNVIGPEREFCTRFNEYLQLPS